METSGYVTNSSECIILSEIGKDWEGKELNEDNLSSIVMWRNYFYKTGNRRHNLVELYRVNKDNEFVRIVDVCSIRLCKNKVDSKLKKLFRIFAINNR